MSSSEGPTPKLNPQQSQTLRAVQNALAKKSPALAAAQAAQPDELQPQQAKEKEKVAAAPPAPPSTPPDNNKDYDERELMARAREVYAKASGMPMPVPQPSYRNYQDDEEDDDGESSSYSEPPYYKSSEPVARSDLYTLSVGFIAGAIGIIGAQIGFGFFG